MTCCGSSQIKLRECMHYYCDTCWVDLQIHGGKCIKCSTLNYYANMYLNPKKEFNQEIEKIIEKYGKKHWELSLARVKARKININFDHRITFVVVIEHPEYGHVGFSCFQYCEEAELFALKQKMVYNNNQKEEPYQIKIYKNITGKINTFGQSWKSY